MIGKWRMIYNKTMIIEIPIVGKSNIKRMYKKYRKRRNTGIKCSKSTKKRTQKSGRIKIKKTRNRKWIEVVIKIS